MQKLTDLAHPVNNMRQDLKDGIK